MNEDDLLSAVMRAQETAEIANAQANEIHANVNDIGRDMATVYTRTDSLGHRIDAANYDIENLRADVDAMRRALTLILGAGWDSQDGPPPEPQPVEDDDIRGFMGEVLYGQP